MSGEALSRLLKALGDPVRLRILSLLPVGDRCDDVYNVSELAQEIGITQPSVSHHLNILRGAGVVQSRKMCRDVYYWIDASQIESAADALRELAVEKNVEVKNLSVE
jgi:ArsR family transcriptional regulator, arsenate/arsenite/antimonite-responsive transcriptional repressor